MHWRQSQHEWRQTSAASASFRLRIPGWGAGFSRATNETVTGGYLSSGTKSTNFGAKNRTSRNAASRKRSFAPCASPFAALCSKLP
eukprot:2689643-Rhodomonas_salina.5